MGSVDKGLQLFKGQPMVLHVLQRLTPQVDRVMINANQNLQAYAAFCAAVWPDTLPDFAGPLAGLQSGLTHCQTPCLVTVPCDSPFVPHDLVERLHAGMQAAAADLAVAVTGPSDQRQSHPVFCLAKTALLPHLTAFLQNGGRKFDAWYATLAVAEVHFADDTGFRNINTIDDLQRFEKI